jgi:putative ABC transport system permease protein
MRTPLAWLNLLHNRARTAVALAGVSFSVLLIFMQLGFLGAVAKTATLIYDGLDFDILLRSPDYLHLADARWLPAERIRQARGAAGVKWSRPLHLNVHLWRNPRTGQQRGILVMGVRPDEMVFLPAEIRSQIELLRRPNAVLIDRQSRRQFGPRNGKRFSDEDVGAETEIGGKRVRIEGHFELGTGLACDGAIIASERSYHEIFSSQNGQSVSLGLIKLEDGSDPAAAAARIRRQLPRDVDVLTRDEVLRFELDRWIHETSVGVIFQLGVGVAVAVGIAIVYQVLSSDVENQLPEYATLKAIGYTNAYMAGVVLRQSLLLALFGYVIGLAAAAGLYRFSSRMANLPIEMNPTTMALVLGLAIVMCSVSGLGALRKAASADPADLF